MKIEKSAALGREIRREEGETLAASTWDEVRAAIRQGRTEEALKGIDYGCAEAQMMHDSMCAFADDALAPGLPAVKAGRQEHSIDALGDVGKHDNVFWVGGVDRNRFFRFVACPLAHVHVLRDAAFCARRTDR